MTVNRPVRILLSLMLAMSLCLALPAVAEEEEGRAITVVDKAWQGIDPYQCNNWTGLQGLVADTLFILDPEDSSNLLPGICKQMKYSDGGLTLRLTVADGLHFASGTQLTPDDLVASLEYGLANSEWSVLYDHIEDMTVEGNDVVLRLSEYRAELAYFLTQPYIAVISREKLESLTPGELRWQAEPYGPFSVFQYEEGAYAVLQPNPYYATFNPLVENKGPVAVASITVRHETIDEALMETTLNEGLLDFMPELTRIQHEAAQNNPHAAILDVSTPNIEYLELNRSSNLLVDANVRQAIMLALDREAIAAALGGSASPSYSMVTPAMTGYTEDAGAWLGKNRADDIEWAEELLGEAGYLKDEDGILQLFGEPLVLRLVTRATQDGAMAAQQVAEQLLAVGIIVEIEPLEWNALYASVESDVYDLALETLRWGDPGLILSACCFDVDNHTDPDGFFDMIERCATTFNDRRRASLLAEAEIALYEDAIIISLYSNVTHAVAHVDLAGVVVAGGRIFFNDVK